MYVCVCVCVCVRACVYGKTRVALRNFLIINAMISSNDIVINVSVPGWYIKI